MIIKLENQEAFITLVINQQVTIGYNGSGNPPTIGNGVMITCGAKVLGDIYIGDNSVIGFGSIVTKSCDSGSIMTGVPAKVVKENINWDY